MYRGVNDVRLEEVPVPEIGPGEILVRVHTCGICGTDLKKIASGSHSAPRIFGHETAGVVAKVGEGVRKFSVGERVVVFHHIPVWRMLLLPSQDLRAVRHLQESRLHGGVRAVGRRICGIRAGDGLDCREGNCAHSGRR